jgi:hypothetical protein
LRLCELRVGGLRFNIKSLRPQPGWTSKDLSGHDLKGKRDEDFHSWPCASQVFLRLWLNDLYVASDAAGLTDAASKASGCALQIGVKSANVPMILAVARRRISIAEILCV